MPIPVAALLAGLVALAATLAVERFGGRWGGVLATVPSTFVPASIGLWSGSGPEGFDRAMAITPVAMWANALFLYSWRVLPPRLDAAARLGKLVGLSLAVWGAAAGTAVFGVGALLTAGAEPAWVHRGMSTLLVTTGLLATWRPVAAPSARYAVSPLILLARVVLPALAIGLALLAAQWSGPLLGGALSVFPAIFLTTMVALHANQGEDIQLGAVGPMMLGTSSMAVYSGFAPMFFRAAGPWGGAGLTWLASVVLGSIPVALWLQRRHQT